MGYSPIIGRFLQRDPLPYIDGPNLFEFEGGNPTNETDPTGLGPATQPTRVPFLGPPAVIRDPGEPVELGGPGFPDTFLKGAQWGDTRRRSDGAIHTKRIRLELLNPLPDCMKDNAAALQHDIATFNLLAQTHEEQNQDWLKRNPGATTAAGTGANDPEEARLLYDLYSLLEEMMSKCDCPDSVNSRKNLQMLKSRLEYWQRQASDHPLPAPFLPVPAPHK